VATVLLFGKLQDLYPEHSTELEIPQSTKSISDLREFVDQKLNLGGALLAETVRIAIDGEMLFDNNEYLGGIEIAFMPPVGGG